MFTVKVLCEIECPSLCECSCLRLRLGDICDGPQYKLRLKVYKSASTLCEAPSLIYLRLWMAPGEGRGRTVSLRVIMTLQIGVNYLPVNNM